MGLVEAWGSGIKRIFNAAEEYGLPKPRFKKLKEYGILVRKGSPKNGYWEIVDKDFGRVSGGIL